jgi:hypothetical protein
MTCLIPSRSPRQDLALKNRRNKANSAKMADDQSSSGPRKLTNEATGDLMEGRKTAGGEE